MLEADYNALTALSGEMGRRTGYTICLALLPAGADANRSVCVAPVKGEAHCGCHPSGAALTPLNFGVAIVPSALAVASNFNLPVDVLRPPPLQLAVTQSSTSPHRRRLTTSRASTQTLWWCATSTALQLMALVAITAASASI
jgi:hypothetical protein